MKKNVIIIMILLIVSILTILLVSKENNNLDSPVLNMKSRDVEKFVDEFKGAYDSEITPNGNITEMDMVAQEGEIEIFDGEKTKVWNYNGQVPGPTIRIKLGDTLRVNFTNDLPQETTVHFHGVRVPNAMDGVPGVTQEAIKTGENFVYEFTPKDAGTFWFHPHVRSSEQVERGLYGVLIVEDEISSQYSQDVVWVVDDWRLDSDKQVNENFNSPMDLMHDGRWGNVITVNGNMNETLNVKPGERIRLRLINTSNARMYAPTFAGLDAKIIATDGMYVGTIFDADGFELAPGNRADIDIKIPEDAEGEYVIKDTFTRRTFKLASIIVAGDGVSTPEFDYPVNKKIPKWSGADSVPIKKLYVLDARRSGSGMGMMGGIEWTINGKAFPDYDPVSLKLGTFNKIRFRNDSSRLHPMHLHGQFFKVIARNGVVVDENYFRDTVLLKGNETIDIALVPLDEGKWVSHCHILEHAEAGMLTVVEVKLED